MDDSSWKLHMKHTEILHQTGVVLSREKHEQIALFTTAEFYYLPLVHRYSLLPCGISPLTLSPLSSPSAV